MEENLGTQLVFDLIEGICLILDCSQSPIFPWDHRCNAINPTTPTQGHFVLSPVSLASRDQDDRPVELNDRHLRSHGKIGDCEQSSLVLSPLNTGFTVLAKKHKTTV